MDTVAALVAAGAVVDAAEKDSDTPLHWAAAGGKKKETVAALVAAGAAAGAMANGGETPLYTLASTGNSEAVAVRVAAVVPLEATNNPGWTLLHWRRE